MECYRIYYCKPDGKGGFKKTTPDAATVFRVFTCGSVKRHVKDFFPLREANEWIKAQSMSPGNGPGE